MKYCEGYFTVSQNKKSTFQALLISKITYATPYLYRRPQESANIEARIRGVYKTDFRLPIYTSMVKLLNYGLHNVLKR